MYQVPSPADGTEEVVTIRLSGAKGKINERKQVLIQKAPSNIFVQLDKPIYKPGQLGKERLANTVWCSAVDKRLAGLLRTCLHAVQVYANSYNVLGLALEQVFSCTGPVHFK